MDKIELYNTLFYVFAAFAAVSFAASVVLFFRFDIPRTYATLTGKTRRRTIQQMEAQKAETGKLRMKYPIPHTGEHTAGTKPTGKTGHTDRTGQRRPHTDQTQRKAPAPRPAPAAQAAPAPRPAPAERKPKQPRQAPPVQARPETGVLAVDAPETMVLQDMPEEVGKTEILSRPATLDFEFRVTQNLIEIHTNELI